MKPAIIIAIVFVLLFFIPPEILGDLEEEIIPEEAVPYRQLTWSDFQATSLSMCGNKTAGACIYTGISVSSRFHKVDSSFCQYEYSILEATAIFHPKKSWGRPDLGDSMLRHEQAHLDISEIHARYLNSEFKSKFLNKTFDCPNGIYDQIPKESGKFYGPILDAKNQMQDLFDFSGETKSISDRQRERADWYVKIDCMLKNNGPSDYCLSLVDETFEQGGCLIATATYGSELAPQVQMLREIRDNSLLQTSSGSAFMESFNSFYYSFSPTIADWERESPVFKETVKLAITPLLTSLSILNYVDIDSEVEVLGYGISLILMNVGMYFVLPAFVIHRVRKFV